MKLKVEFNFKLKIFLIFRFHFNRLLFSDCEKITTLLLFLNHTNHFNLICFLILIIQCVTML